MLLQVAVIGAGAAGLVAARHLAAESTKFNFTVFEQNERLGGTWVYDERSGLDELGIPIHTSMYQGLRTNLPKEVMGYPDFPIQQPSDKSYIAAKDMLQFLNNYAQHFHIIPFIKFRHLVKNVETGGSKNWIVTVKDVLENTTKDFEYDAVMVCNGHYHTPNLPKFEEESEFKGRKMHSHDYRKPELFRGQNVVVVGAGPSGLDIALDIASFADKVFLSHHLPDPIDTVFPSNFSFKPDIKTLSETKITFVDDTSEEADCILHCTGYVYSFPFLSHNCGVNVINNYVTPLYKHLIVTNNPTMCLVGLPFYVCANRMFDLQVRFFLKSLDGSLELPNKEDMLEDERIEIAKRRDEGFSFRDSHKMGPLQNIYYDDLASTAGIAGVPPVMTKLHNESSRRFLEDLRNYREDRYMILNDYEYEEIK